VVGDGVGAVPAALAVVGAGVAAASAQVHGSAQEQPEARVWSMGSA